MTSAIKPQPPTLSHEASATFLDDFANCDSSRDDGRLACRIFRAEPNGMPLWITRIGGCDLGANVETTVVSFTGYPLTPDESGEDDGNYNGYSPAATYEGDRVFFAGRREATRWLLDAIEDVASTSVEMARAFVNDYCEDQGFEAALFEWPQNDVAVLTLCNAQHYGERGLAVASVMEQVEKNSRAPSPRWKAGPSTPIHSQPMTFCAMTPLRMRTRHPSEPCWPFSIKAKLFGKNTSARSKQEPTARILKILAGRWSVEKFHWRHPTPP